MPDLKVDRIKEFPQDDRLWWVRWVDRYRVPKGSTATPGVEVLLSPLDIPLSELSRANIREIVAPKTVASPPPQARILVFTGFIPRLAIGTVFLDGVEVGSLPFKTAEFDLKNFTVSVCSINEELDTRPGWWKKEFPYRVINRRDYSLAAFPDVKKSQAVVIRSDEATIVLPCHEVFRAMYAPHSEIARALTSGPWQLTKTMVINPDETLLRSDGNWQVTLRRRVNDPFGDLLANLCLSEAGKAGANSIYTGFLRNDGPGYMTAPIPFELNHLRFKVLGLRADGSPDKFLALQLLAMEWPDAPPIVPFRDNCSKKGEIQTRVPRDKPYATYAASPSADEDGIVTANSEEDPLSSSTVTTFVTPSVQWSNRPREIEEKKRESYIYDGRRHNDDPCEVSGVSPGTNWSGNTDSGSAAYSAEGRQTRDQSERIGEVIKMFERLQSSGELTHWEPVERSFPLRRVNGVSLWRLPLYAKDTKQFLAFGYLDRANRQRRGALVCELRFQGHTIYWLEIELRPSEPGRKALIYSVSKQNFLATTYRLLEIAAQSRGKWPPAEELALFTDISAAESWRHTFIGKATKEDRGRLNERLAMLAISRVAIAWPQKVRRGPQPQVINY